MRTWWSCNSLAEVLRPESLVLNKEDYKRYKILTFSAWRAFFSSAFR